MPEFLKLLPPKDALHTFFDNLPSGIKPEIERCQTENAHGRVLAVDVFAPHPMPEFSKSTVDGYAVWAKNTFGATESQPAYLRIAGEVQMGRRPVRQIEPGTCMVIHTGGMLPDNADAVVMLEYTQQSLLDEIEILRPVAKGENVIQVGEEIVQGEIFLQTGKKISIAELGGLLALGITEVPVFRRPKIGIISTGDEVVPPDQRAEPGTVRDVNSYTLAALVREVGGDPELYGIVKDDFDQLRDKAIHALRACQALIITAGSSASARDMTATVINELGQPGVVVHGVNVKPGKPTILGVCGGKPVIGLPGNPVSAYVIARLFVAPLVEALTGQNGAAYQPSIKAALAINLASQSGREEWIPVKLRSEGTQTLAEPVFSKSNLILNLANIDGFIHIVPSANGIPAGTIVDVLL